MTKMTQSRINALEIENAELRRQLENRPTLRDQFAMAAIHKMVLHDHFSTATFAVAKYAYEVADAMMEARNAG